MNVERLQKIVKFLETLPPEKLAIKEWVTQCNSVCCVIGWFPVIFPDDWQWYELGYGTIFPELFSDEGIGVDPWDATLEFLDINFVTARALFSARDYWANPTPLDVAAMITGLISSEEVS